MKYTSKNSFSKAYKTSYVPEGERSLSSRTEKDSSKSNSVDLN